VSAHLAVGFVEILGRDVGHEVDLIMNFYHLDAGPRGGMIGCWREKFFRFS
jgi:hypothetical protein